MFTGQCSTYLNGSLTKAKPTMQVPQDHSLGAVLFFVFSFFLENLCSAKGLNPGVISRG